MKITSTVLSACLWFVLLFLSGTGLYAQDIIVDKQGNETEALILKVLPETIEYKKGGNENGPTYVVKKSAVFMIKYANGSKDVFTNGSDKKSSDGDRQKIENAESKAVPSLPLSEKVTQLPQKKRPTLTVFNGFFGPTIMEAGQSLRHEDLVERYQIAPDILSYYNSARSLGATAALLAFPGVAVLTWQLGTMISGADANAAAFALSTTGLVLGVCLGVGSNTMKKKTVNKYNTRIKELGKARRPAGFEFSLHFDF